MKKIFFSTCTFLLLVPCLVWAQWAPLPSVPNGDVGCLLKFANRIYTSGDQGEMSWTSDDGASWNDATNGLPYEDGAISMTSIGNVLIAGTTYDLMFISTDSGASWKSCNWPYLTGTNVRTLITHDGYVFEGGDGIFRSSDSGRDWEWDTSGSSEFLEREVTYFASGDSVLLAGGANDYIQRSTNDGNSWDTVRITDDPNVGDYVTTLAFIGRVVLAGTSGGLYRSTDLGLTWSHIDTSQFNYHHSLASLLTLNGDVILGAGGSVLKSTDSGFTWVPFNQGIPPGSDAVSYLLADSNYLFASHGGGDGGYRRPISDLAGVKQMDAAPPDSPVLSFYNSSLNVASQSLIHSIKLFDILGRVVRNVESAGTSINMDLHGLAAGFYFVRIATDAGESLRKIVL